MTLHLLLQSGDPARAAPGPPAHPARRATGNTYSEEKRAQHERIKSEKAAPRPISRMIWCAPRSRSRWPSRPSSSCKKRRGREAQADRDRGRPTGPDRRPRPGPGAPAASWRRFWPRPGTTPSSSRCRPCSCQARTRSPGRSFRHYPVSFLTGDTEGFGPPAL